MTVQEVAVRERKTIRKTLVSAFKGAYGANLTLLLTLIIMIVVFSLSAPNFFKMNNLLNIARSIAIIGVVAVGETLVLIAGGIDMSVSAVMAFGGMAAAVTLRDTNLPFAAAFLISLSVGAFIGLLNGLIVTKIHINPLITTLGMGMVVRGFAYIGSAGNTLTITNPGFSDLGRGRFLDIVPWPVIILVIVYLAAQIFLTRTLAGRYVYAIGGNPIACRLAGLDVDRWRLLFYSLSGLMAGFAGYMLSSLVGASMGNAATGVELDIIAGVILGGASLAGGEGTMVGTLLGILLLGTLTNGLIMLNVPTFWQMVARGAVLMTALFIDSWRSGGYK